MEHPNSLDLEAFACGETTRDVATHLDACTACSTFVERLRKATAAHRSNANVEELVARAASRAIIDDAPFTTAPKASSRTASTSSTSARHTSFSFVRASAVAVPLAAAAALVLILRAPSTKDVLVPGPAAQPDPPGATPQPTTDPTPETTFKGKIPIAVIRERAGEQARFTRTVRVRPGDRLRVEVALDRDQAILAAVMGDDASWLELMPEGVRRAGTHFSERSARVDASPMRGVILVGAPDAVARARATNRFDAVSAVRVEWEAP